MITHTPTFESLAVAPVKQTNVIVARQVLTETGYEDDTLVWESSTVLMEVNIDAIGHILGTATKKAVVKLIGIQDDAIVGDTFQVRTGLYDTTELAFEYISQGFFIVESIDYNYEAGSTTVTLYDHMWTANTLNYSESVPSNLITYPVTVEEFAGYLATLIDVTLMDDFDLLPNADYEITEDLYSLISGATIRNAIQDIAGATGTTARITDTTLVFSPYEVDDENLDSDTLKTLKIGDTYGPITSVVLGRQPQNDNIAIFAANPTESVVESVDTTGNLITITGNGMIDGNMIRFVSTGTLPAPLTSVSHYYVFTDGSEDDFSLAPTYTDAIAGTNLINLTTVGSGIISIAPFQTYEIQINNNEILDDARQELLPPLYNVLSGIDWSDVESDTVGLGWHEVGDVIQFTQGATTVRAFLSEVHSTFAGSIRENLVSDVPELASIDYQAAGGVTKTLYNTEIKVDKQAQDITSIVSQQSEFEGEVQEDFTEVYQNITNILLTIQKSGGGNLILNSVGFATETDIDIDDTQYDRLSFWYYNHNNSFDFPTDGLSDPNSLYEIDTMGTATSFSSSESQNAGGISGQVIEFNSDGLILEQIVDLAVDTPLCFGLRVNKALVSGSAVITLSNDIDSWEIEIEDLVSYEWEELSLENFMVSQPWLKISIETTDAEHLKMTDLRLFYGTTLQVWTQSNAEILSTNVQFSKNGMKIFDNVHDTETQVTYNEFSTRRKADDVVLFEADDSGVVTNDLTIKGTTSYTSGDDVLIKQVTIPASSALAGIAFIKVA